MSRVDLVKVATKLRDGAVHLDRYAYCPSRDEALAIADLVEKARALLDYQELGAPDFPDWDRYYDALAALFDKEGK